MAHKRCQGYGRQPPQILVHDWTGSLHTAGQLHHCTAHRHSCQLQCKLRQGRRGKGGGAKEEGQRKRGKGGAARKEG